MKYEDPRLRSELAAQYALGTLRGAARRRFERLMREDPTLAALVEEWGLKLGRLAEAGPGVEPPERLWSAIERRLPARATAPGPGVRLFGALFRRPPVPVPRFAEVGLWYCVGFWRAAGLVATAASLVLLAVLALRPPATAPDYVAVLTGEGARPAFVASFEAGARLLALRPVERTQPAPDKSLELWLVPPDGGAPRSLGLLGEGAQTLRLAAADAADFATAALAVSLEPKGGSPTGAPTGPVLYLGPVLPAPGDRS
jgi:anti-sigma-K factor RskA